MPEDPFTFTVTDAARFLGKSSVTLRKWEKQGLVKYPRLGADRHFTTTDLRDLCDTALAAGRVSRERVNEVNAALTLLEIIENENRNFRSTRKR